MCPPGAPAPGRSPACEHPCYSFHIEQHRPSVHDSYQRNLTLSRRPDFAERLTEYIARRRMRRRPRACQRRLLFRRLRPTVADRVMRRSQQTRLFFYSGACLGELRPSAACCRRCPALENVRALGSAATATLDYRGEVPAGVQVGLADDHSGRSAAACRPDLPSAPPPHSVRKWLPWSSGGSWPGSGLPTENGITGGRSDRDRCAVCWKPLLPSPEPGRLSLTLVLPV